MFIRLLIAFLLTALVPPPAAASDAAARSAARHRLQQQQLQDELALRLQQDMARSRPGLTSRDRQKLDELQLRQRMDQQLLDQQQLIESRRFAHDPARTRVYEHIQTQERDQQLQRFGWEQQQLLQSMPSAPLQPVPRPGELQP